MQWKIPLFKPYWEEEDIESVSKIIRRGTHWAIGPEIKEFEEDSNICLSCLDEISIENEIIIEMNDYGEDLVIFSLIDAENYVNEDDYIYYFIYKEEVKDYEDLEEFV